MVFAGIITTFLGFVLAVSSLAISASNTGRLGIVLVGIVVSVVGILGLLNPHYQKTAVWKK